MIRLASRYTVARMLERDDFKKRFANNQSIAIHEFIYPLWTDSYIYKQMWNQVAQIKLSRYTNGRELQKWGQKPQVAITLPLLVGLDGEKMSSAVHWCSEQAEINVW